MANKQDSAPDDRVDLIRLLVALVGAASVGLGAWMHYPPLGPISFGGLLVAAAVIGMLRGR